MTVSVKSVGSFSVVWRSAAVCLSFLLPALTGCGGATGEVGGKVATDKAEAVKGGTLIFSQVGGGASPVSAQIQADGGYKLSTGLPPGRYKVTFTPPQQELTEQQRTDPKYVAPPPPYMNMAPKPDEVEVKAGANTLDLTLAPK